MTDVPLPAGVEALLSEADDLLGGNVTDRHLMGAAAAVGYYVASRNLPRSALIGLLVVTVLHLRSIDGRLEAIGEMDESQRIEAMQNLEEQIAPEANDE